MASCVTPCGFVRRRLLMVLLWLLAGPAAAQWTVAQLDDLATAFSQGIGASYTVATNPWYFALDCNQPDCLSDNPDTVYGYPNFGTQPGQVRPDRALATTGAVVLVMETPPPMRYFGVTAYMGTRYYARLPGKPQVSGTVAVSESLTDTTSLAVIGTTGSATPGVNVFTQLAVFVLTADARTLADVTAQLTALGFPAYAINALPLPISVQPTIPLVMGTAPTSDTYSPVMRLTYPRDAAQEADYIQRAPIRTFYLVPRAQRLLTPVPPTPYRTPGTGVAEPTAWRQAQTLLVNKLLAQYGPQFASITETRPVVSQTENYTCIAKALSCQGDNPDGLYVMDAGVGGNLAPAADDRILVVGVNHSSPVNGSGKATYYSHALEVLQTHGGVIAVSDTWLDGSGLVAAGITSPGDPRYETYRHLYAFSLAYNCPPGDTLCVTIPQGPGGVPIGTPIGLLARIYLEPATRTRPSPDEIVLERVFVMKKVAAALP